ncbi:MAG TPA: hypothetical protein VNB03_00045 [Casimicrobiaceae bacterium]|nr:hypothetical protein [Casimicrobiaceae bacterium]
MPTLCPIAIAVGCRRCPIFKVCPVKGVIGDLRGGPAETKAPPAAPERTGRADKRARPKRKGRRARARRHA